jgi:hypothetical protein
MKKTLIPLFIALSMQSFAQSKLALGFVGSVDMCRLSNGYGEPSSIGTFYTEPGMGYQGGLRMRLMITNVVSFHTGFSMVSHTVKSEKMSLNYGSLQSSSLPVAIQQEETFKAFQVPLLCSFYFGQQWKFGFTIGPAVNYVYREDRIYYAYYASETKTYNYSFDVTSQNQFLSAVAGLGAEYHLPHWIFRVEPTVNGQLFFFDNKRANESFRLWSAGIALSGFYRF